MGIELCSFSFPSNRTKRLIGQKVLSPSPNRISCARPDTTLACGLVVSKSSRSLPNLGYAHFFQKGLGSLSLISEATHMILKTLSQPKIAQSPNCSCSAQARHIRIEYLSLHLEDFFPQENGPCRHMLQQHLVWDPVQYPAAYRQCGLIAYRHYCVTLGFTR